jgi:hypothetical protein
MPREHFDFDFFHSSMPQAMQQKEEAGSDTLSDRLPLTAELGM